MEVNLAMDITAEEFFDSIFASLEYDIKQATGKTVRAARIKPGYHYNKKLNSKMGHGASVTVTVEELDYPRIYKARFDSATGINYICYEVEELDNGQIGLSYSESYEGSKRTYNYNGMFFTWLMTIPNKRHLRQQFRALEKQVLDSRSDKVSGYADEVEAVHQEEAEQAEAKTSQN